MAYRVTVAIFSDFSSGSVINADQASPFSDPIPHVSDPAPSHPTSMHGYVMRSEAFRPGLHSPDNRDPAPSVE